MYTNVPAVIDVEAYAQQLVYIFVQVPSTVLMEHFFDIFGSNDPITKEPVLVEAACDDFSCREQRDLVSDRRRVVTAIQALPAKKAAGPDQVKNGHHDQWLKATLLVILKSKAS